jgi:LysR family transcriptional regulator, transcription activator of glutamate synthase operon
MELRTLAYLVEVARLGSFTAAARSMHVAQPAISAQVANLERELGARLFVRAHRRVTLTDAGERVVARARRMLAEADRIRADIADLTDLLTGRLRIGATPLLSGLDLPAAIAAFHRAHPAVALHLTTALIDPLLDRLAAGELDAVVGPVSQDRRFDLHVLAEESVVLVSPPDRDPPRTLAAAAAEPWVCLPAGSGLRGILDRAADFTPNVVIETATPWQIREFVSAGLGVALLAASIAYAPGPPVRITPLDPAPPHPPLAVAVTGHSRTADAFAALLSDQQATPP